MTCDYSSVMKSKIISACMCKTMTDWSMHTICEGSALLVLSSLLCSCVVKGTFRVLAGTTQPDSIRLEIIDLKCCLAVKKYCLGCVSRNINFLYLNHFESWLSVTLFVCSCSITLPVLCCTCFLVLQSDCYIILCRVMVVMVVS